MKEEIFNLLEAGFIAIITCALTLFVERRVDNIGELTLYYQFIENEAWHKPWGVQQYNDRLLDRPSLFALEITVIFSLQNTSKSPKVIRDLCLNLYNGDKFVAKMEQLISDKGQNSGEIYYEGIDETYSFVVSPQNFQTVRGLYYYEISEHDVQTKHFDTITISYYDEKNIRHNYIAKTGINGWEPKIQKPDYERNFIVIKPGFVGFVQRQFKESRVWNFLKKILKVLGVKL